MDELWQRYRTFWMPVLIGLGVFLLGVIVVHMITDDPEEKERRLNRETRNLRRMQVPESNMSTMLKDKGVKMRENITDWAKRVDQTGTAGRELVTQGATQALRAALLRGAPDDESVERMAARFGDDPSAATRAKQRFKSASERLTQLLSTGDPNVAFSRLLSEVWTELRVRANRADMELADNLGFGAVSSVNRATLPGRVLNLALVARIVDNAIRNDMTAIEQIGIESLARVGTANDFITKWPVRFTMVGPFRAIQHVLDDMSDPTNPTPIVDTTTITQPRSRRGGVTSGVARLEITLASAVVRADVDLGLEGREEDR